jgi:hypothetical protein
MPANYGQGSTFQATDKGLYLNIEKEIKKYPSPRIELLKRIGGFEQEIRSHKVEWSLRDNRPVKAKAAVQRASGAAQLIVDTPGVFNVDDLIEYHPDGDSTTRTQLVVEAVQGGTDLTVRFWAGTDQAVVVGGTVKRIGGATPQGKDADNMVISGFEDLYNYTSILEDVVDLSGTQHQSLIRGDENSGELIARKQQELGEVWQSQMVLGIRKKNDVYKTHTAGGIRNLIDTYAPENAINFGGSAIWAEQGDDGALGVIDDALDNLSSKVFGKPVMYVGAKFMRKFKYAIADSNIQTTQELNNTRGVGVVGKYLSHLYGPIDVVLIQERTGWMDDLVFLVDESDLGQKAAKGRDWQTYPLGRKGDSFQWQILSERTVKMGNPHAHAYIYNLGL